jgi:hypothetical protein
MAFCFLAFVTVADAQVRKRTAPSKNSKSKKEQVVKEETSFLDKGYAELKFGNLGFFNGLTISSKLDVGYKFHDRFSVGGGFKLFYDQFSVIGPDPSIFDLGGFLLARGKITNEIYFQAEYAFMSYAYSDAYFTRNFPDGLNKSVNSPLFGLGYMSGSDKWRFGIELMYIASESARDFQGSVIEYWFGASYNF